MRGRRGKPLAVREPHPLDGPAKPRAPSLASGEGGDNAPAACPNGGINPLGRAPATRWAGRRSCRSHRPVGYRGRENLPFRNRYTRAPQLLDNLGARAGRGVGEVEVRNRLLTEPCQCPMGAE